MAYLHQTGWAAPSERELKSFTMIDDEMIEHFKAIVARKARCYERNYVAEIDK